MRRPRPRSLLPPTPAAFALAEKAGSVDAYEEWILVLDELAGQLARLRGDDSSLLELSNTPWPPPVGLGDLPADLAPRAAALIEEMDALRPLLVQRGEATMKQLRAVESVPRETSMTSVYLDSVG